MQIIKLLRKIHTWIGICIFPWVFLVGFTGFYLNHSKAISAFVLPAPYDESQFVSWPDVKPVEQDQAVLIAQNIWPEEEIEKVRAKDYHKRPSFVVEKPSGDVIVNQATGHYFVKTRWTNTIFAPDGRELSSKIYWKTILQTLHERGWLSNRFGTFLADITSLSLMTFALSGIILWYLPRKKGIARKLRRITGRGV